MSQLTAVILAAGRGTRLGSALDGKPKGFLPFNDTTFIERALDILALAGIANTVIVTGHNAHHYEDLALRRGASVTTLHNPEFIEKGSMQSLLVALESLTGNLLIMDADIVYESRAIFEIVQNRDANAILLSNISGAGDENLVWTYQTEAKRECLKLISKDLHALPSPIVGEHVGIVKLGEELANSLRQIAPQIIAEVPLTTYEQCLTPLLIKHPMFTHKIADLIWTEVDDLVMWQRAQAHIFPRLLD